MAGAIQESRKDCVSDMAVKLHNVSGSDSNVWSRQAVIMNQVLPHCLCTSQPPNHSAINMAASLSQLHSHNEILPICPRRLRPGP